MNSILLVIKYKDSYSTDKVHEYELYHEPHRNEAALKIMDLFKKNYSIKDTPGFLSNLLSNFQNNNKKLPRIESALKQVIANTMTNTTDRDLDITLEFESHFPEVEEVNGGNGKTIY
jgi:hypothetical protein